MAASRCCRLANAVRLDGFEKQQDNTRAKIAPRALEEPLGQIAHNPNIEGSVIVNDVRNPRRSQGLDAIISEIVDLVAAGVIDAATVTRSALQNAASIAKKHPHH